jgi:hypothetical protein
LEAVARHWQWLGSAVVVDAPVLAVDSVPKFTGIVPAWKAPLVLLSRQGLSLQEVGNFEAFRINVRGSGIVPTVRAPPVWLSRQELLLQEVESFQGFRISVRGSLVPRQMPLEQIGTVS